MAGLRIAPPDPSFEVVELPGEVLLVGSPDTGFETISVSGYKPKLVTRLTARLFAIHVNPICRPV
jgi:hypothetical protein